ncbi:MAG TPA: hypothetical protein VIH57_07835 [Bacteroidales bacterium]
MKGIKQSQNHKSQKISPGIFFYLLCLSALFVTGCSKYQYISIDSYLNKNENSEFVDETDTVKMKYNFTGRDFPITITVFNKLQQPLYFDWKNSSVIMNDTPIDDAFDNEDQVDSIAPQSSVTIRSNNLSDKFIPLSHKDKKVKTVIRTAAGNSQVDVHVFDDQTSPVFFRSVLAITAEKDLSSSLLYDHPFWVSGVYQVYDVTPTNSPSDSPSNQFYMEKLTGFTKFMGYTGLTILLVALAAISPQSN